MVSSLLSLVSSPDDSSGRGFDSRQAAELERIGQFGLRHRDLAGVVPAGSVSIDAATGIGGFPRGRMLELFGPPGVGKTTLGLQAVAAVQRSGGIVAFVDAEFGFDAGYAARMGVDIEALLLARTNDGHQAFGVIEKLAASQSVDLIVVDSLAALMPAEESAAAIGAAEPFGQSEMLASGLRRLARALLGSPTCVLFLNQMRAYHGYGYEETSCGGWSLKMHAAFRADLHEQSRTQPRRRLRLRVIKNQMGSRGEVQFDFEGGIGVVPEAELIDRGLECGVVTKGPAGLMFDGQSLGADRTAAVERLAGHATLAAQVRTEVRLALGITQRRPMGREETPSVMPASAANG